MSAFGTKGSELLRCKLNWQCITTRSIGLQPARTGPVSNPTTGTENGGRPIIEHEIGPLLREYWFDQGATAQKYVEELLAAQ